MLDVHLLLLYFLDTNDYEVTSKGSMCGNPENEIDTEAECQKAASSLGIQWHSAYVGHNDFPKCLYAQDSRNLVYFNQSPNPGRINVNSDYSAICKVNEGKELNV